MSLRLLSVSRRFGRQHALDDLSLHVRRGDCYGFLGHNGAGKTTALRILLGLMRPHAGRALVDGFDVRQHPREARARMGGLVEVPGFHPGANGMSNLRALARLGGLDATAARRECERVLELVGLEHAGSKAVRAYSQGMRQRLGLAQALLGQPPYVLLDEPTNGLDPEGISDFRDILKRIRQEHGVTVLLSSHQLSEVSEICNRIGIIRRGRMTTEASVEELVARMGNGPYRLDADHPETAKAALASIGVATTAGAGDSLIVDLGERSSDDVVAALAAAGSGLRAFGPQRSSLEDVYLTGDPQPVTEGPGDEPPSIGAPGERLACSAPTARLLRYDLRRSRGIRLATLLAAPAALAAAGIHARGSQHAADAAEVDAGALASTTAVTAFEALGRGLQSGLPLLTFIAIGLASQSISGELSQGTLRNVLLRPVTRFQVATGKAISVLAVVATSYILLWAAALAMAAWAFDFKDVVEILPNGAEYVYVEADELWSHVRPLALAPLLPLAAYSGLGFLIGALTRRATGALVLALLCGVFIDVGRTIARTWRIEEFLPSAYLPSPLGDTSHVAFYIDTVTGTANATSLYADTATHYPLVVTVACFALAALALARRSVP